MSYQMVFDVRAHPFQNWWVPAFGLLFCALGALMVFRPQFLARLGGNFANLKERRLFCWAFFVFSLAWVAAASTSIFGDDLQASRAAQHGDCVVTEGLITNFHPAPAGGHDSERFTVSGVDFDYSDYIVTAGFHKSAAHGGPIREGLPVRICSSGGEILRLEVRR